MPCHQKRLRQALSEYAHHYRHLAPYKHVYEKCFHRHLYSMYRQQSQRYCFDQEIEAQPLKMCHLNQQESLQSQR